MTGLAMRGLGLTISAVSPTRPSIAAGLRQINPTPLTSSEVPTIVWFGLGALVVGGVTYYFMRRRST